MSLFPVLADTPASETRATFPLTCSWCRSSPASHLLVMDRRSYGRQSHVVCFTCAHRDQDRARDVASSPASVWLFELHPDGCVLADNRKAVR